MKKTISIICPLYNAEEYILDLNKNILNQKDVEIKEIKYLLTESKDNTKSIMEDNNIEYQEIKRKIFHIV